MLNWPAKDPDEVLDYEVDWTDRLAGDTIATSIIDLAAAAGIVIDSQSNTTVRSKVWLSGGTSGSTAVLRARVTTAGGRTLEETISLPIVSSTYAAAPASGYSPPTAAGFVTRFPAFQAVAAAVIEHALTAAARMVDETWAEDDFAEARMIYAAHLLTLDGLGSSRESQLLGLKRIGVGSLELERGGQNAFAGSLTSTSYGVRFAELRRLNFAGGGVTG